MHNRLRRTTYNLSARSDSNYVNVCGSQVEHYKKTILQINTFNLYIPWPIDVLRTPSTHRQYVSESKAKFSANKRVKVQNKWYVDRKGVDIKTNQIQAYYTNLNRHTFFTMDNWQAKLSNCNAKANGELILVLQSAFRRRQF